MGNELYTHTYTTYFFFKGGKLKKNKNKKRWKAEEGNSTKETEMETRFP